jgi:cob(I)alamin adenosyltransferase
MVVLNRIYTRTGDDGTTALGSGERRPKYDLRVAAYGTVDETNAVIGVVRLHLQDGRELDTMLGLIQNDLFDLGADLAVPQREGKAERLRVVSSQVERLERDIDSLNANLAPLASFVLPGGTPAAQPSPTSRSAARRSSISTACRISCLSPAVRRTIMAQATCSGCPARTVEAPQSGRFLPRAR